MECFLDGKGVWFYSLACSVFAPGQLLGQTALNLEEMETSETLSGYIIFLKSDSNSSFASWKV